MDNQTMVNEMIAKGRKALAELESYSQEQIDELCRICCEPLRHMQRNWPERQWRRQVLETCRIRS